MSNDGMAAQGQDRLVKALVREPGFFLDIGCCHPCRSNNTFALEQAGWRGLCLDTDQTCLDRYPAVRKTPAVNFDCLASTKAWLRLLEMFEVPPVIDYMSVDVDDANLQVMQNFPFEQYEFKVMTFETDVYRIGSKLKDAAISRLHPFGCYALLLEDASLRDWYCRPWEDWWVNEKYIQCQHLYVSAMGWLEFVEMLEHDRRIGGRV